MTVLFSFGFGLIVGFIIGALSYKNNVAKFDSAEARAKEFEQNVEKGINKLKK